MSRISLQRWQAVQPATRAAPDLPNAADLDLLARWMDSAVRLPGGIRIGFDAILGLIPGVGDAVAALASVYIINRAHGMGVGRATLARLSLNVAGDMIVGAIPIAGDVLDVFWKSNQRNVALLRRHALATPSETRKMRLADRLFVSAVVVLLVALAIGGIAAAYFLLAWFLTGARQLFG